MAKENKEFDVKQFIENEKLEIEKKYIEGKESVKRRQKDLDALRKDFEEKIKPKFPKDTGIIKKLEQFAGKNVNIVVGYDKTREDKSYNNTNFNYSGRRILIGAASYPLIGMDWSYIKKVTDIQTNEVIFENNCRELPVEFQEAIILGTDAGQVALDETAERIKWSEKYYEKEHKESLEALEKIPGYIEEGKKYIYPERLENWKECVCNRVSDIYHGSDLMNALEVMKALDEGKSLKEVGKIIDNWHSGASFGMLCNVVVHFSKRGPEFYREYYDSYKLAKGEEKQKHEDFLKKIEKENAEFEAKLQKGE